MERSGAKRTVSPICYTLGLVKSCNDMMKICGHGSDTSRAGSEGLTTQSNRKLRRRREELTIQDTSFADWSNDLLSFSVVHSRSALSVEQIKWLNHVK